MEQHTHIFVTYEIFHFTPSSTIEHSALIEVAKMNGKPFTLAEIETYLHENVEIESRSLKRKPSIKRIVSMQGINVPSLSQL